LGATKHLVPRKLAGRIRRLDLAYKIVRHLSTAYLRDTLRELQEVLCDRQSSFADDVSPVSDASETTASTSLHEKLDLLLTGVWRLLPSVRTTDLLQPMMFDIFDPVDSPTANSVTKKYECEPMPYAVVADPMDTPMADATTEKYEWEHMPYAAVANPMDTPTADARTEKYECEPMPYAAVADPMDTPTADATTEYAAVADLMDTSTADSMTKKYECEPMPYAAVADPMDAPTADSTTKKYEWEPMPHAIVANPMDMLTAKPKNELMNERSFEVDDWVIDNRRLASIVRIGYGAYAGEARVVRPDESPSEFTAGRWTRIAGLLPISLPMKFVVTPAEVATANDPPVYIAKGTIITLTGFDNDGDLKVLIDGHAGRHAIFMHDAVALQCAS